MALSLDGTLAAAQNSLSRRPIAEILSTQAVPDIPFDGQILNPTSTDEQRPNVITHSSGRLCLIYNYGSALKYVYTDVNRTEFHFVDIPASSETIVEATLAELPNGNIGIVYYSTSSTQNLRRMVITVTGQTVSAVANIQAYGVGAHLLSAPFVARLVDNSFLLVYSHYKLTGGVWAYEISKRTSADFLTWSAEGTCSISGLDPAKRIGNPSFLQISTGQIWLWWDYLDSVSGPNELINLYFSTSDDNGVTWAGATKFTNNTTYDSISRHPFLTQKVANQLHLLFYDQKSCLHMDTSQDGHCSPSALMATNLTFDSANGKLYVVDSWVSAGDKLLHCVFRVDIATWTIDACWNSDTVPGFRSIFTDPLGGTGFVWYNANHGEGHLIPVGLGSPNFGQIHIDLLDGEADTITHFDFHDWPSKGITKNVTWTPVGDDDDFILEFTWVDEDSNRLYAVLSHIYVYDRRLQIGYFDLTEAGGVHTFVDVLREQNQITEWVMSGLSDGCIRIVPEADLIIVSYAFLYEDLNYQGRVRVYSGIDNPVLYKDYHWETHPNFPYHGLKKLVYSDGKIYGDFTYSTFYEEADKRGLCIIDLSNDNITYQRPTWATLDSYGLRDIKATSDGKLIIAAMGHGITIYDIATSTWTLYDNDSIPGMDTPGIPDMYQYLEIAYDEADGLIFSGSAGVNASNKLIAFSQYGFLRQSVYQVGSYTDSWAWGAKANLTQGLLDYEIVAALHPSDRTMYVFWTNQAKDEFSIKWDKEGTSLDLSPYLVRGREITLARSVDGTPASLGFTVSHGYLFDHHNSGSLYSIYLKKGRKLTCRMGEKVSGTDYWQEMGVFFVKETSLVYERGTYPEMRVAAEDIRQFWDQGTILATNSYETTPKEVMENLLSTHGGLGIPDMDIPTFDDSTTLYCQWLEASLKSIIDEVAERFGYFVRTDYQGKVTCRKISDANPVDHVYTGKAWLVNFTPDDTNSDFTNRIIVTCKSRDQLPVTYPEERVGQLNGTVGWFGFKKEFNVYYSLDQSRICYYPRLVVIESVTSLGFKLAALINQLLQLNPLFKIDPIANYFFKFTSGTISQAITYEDPNHKYCTITVTVPSLIPQLLTFLGMACVGYILGDMVVSLGGGFTIPVGRAIEKVAIISCLLVMSSIGNFQYEVWAVPTGTVGQTFQGQADDLALQGEIGRVITRKSENPLCYTVQDCNKVANQEILLCKLQRNGLAFTKTGHLQDEEGDTIQIAHPYSGASLTVFINKLTRRLSIPSSPNSDDGYLLDDIEGWKL